MSTTVTLLPGDGASRELVEPVLAVLEAVGADLDFEPAEAGHEAFRRGGESVPRATLESIRRNKVALSGRLAAGPADPYPNPRWDIRRQLDLFAAVLPIRNLRGLPSRHQGVDVVVIRQSTEDVYAGLEDRIREGLAVGMKVVTQAAAERITRFAFEWARRNGRREVALVHKANIMKTTDGLFLDTAREVAKGYADLRFRTLIVDNACMQLLLRPEQFDVLLTGSLYGSILGGLGAGIVGGMSAGFGVGLGDELALFEALHGDAPQLEGTGKANPLPLLLPACSMLEHLGKPALAGRAREAISRTLEQGVATPDLGGKATTAEMTKAIIGNL